MNSYKNQFIFEYIWLDGNGGIRSKTKVIQRNQFEDIKKVPDWNFDGSSTGQIQTNDETEHTNINANINANINTEVILKPCCIFKDPLRENKKYESFLVLCDTYDISGNPHITNHRYNANKIFSTKSDEIPWFGLEQEYFISRHTNRVISANFCNSTEHYCGTIHNDIERQIVESHLEKCIETGLQISGINAEVANCQWEFQVGPCVGIDAADHLIIARYLLERIAERFNADIVYEPKPNINANGSGCHINFSTKSMREPGGLAIIESCMEKLEKNHEKHISVYGKDNHRRLTGIHETSDINKFTYGIGTRNTSVRIPNQTVIDNCGYFEDRRPASNIDPYQATSVLFETCCLE